MNLVPHQLGTLIARYIYSTLGIPVRNFIYKQP